MLKKINKILSIAFTTLLFFACSNISEEVAEQANESGAFLKIAIEESSARTIYPNIDLSLDDFETIKLESSVDSVKTMLATWTTTNGKSAYAQMSEAKVAVSKGDFLFILTATKGEKTMCGETSLTIDKIENTVSFTLLPYSGDGSGNIDVKIRYTNTDIGCVKAGLFDFENIENPVAGYEAKRLTPTEESGTYTVEYKEEGVAAGKYMLTFFFYADSEGTVLLNTYNETVVVGKGFTSEKSRDFGDMNATYTITYELNGGTENDNPKSYTIYSLPLTLKSPKKEGYSFLGWYEDVGCTSGRVRQILPDGIGNKTLYAKWAEATEFTKDTVDEINSDCNNKVIKVTGEIDDATISTLNTKTKSLSGITLDLSEATIDSIPESAFCTKSGYTYTGNTALVEVILPDCVTSIGYIAFYKCTGLTSVEIPSSVTSIGSSAFGGCSGLKSVEISSDVTSIGEDAFYNCTGLTSVEISSGVTSIGEDAFSGCTGLTSVTIPNSVTSIGSYAFFGCDGLTSVTFADTSSWWYATSANAKSGTSIDVGTPATNATNLKSSPASWYNKYLFKGTRN